MKTDRKRAASRTDEQGRAAAEQAVSELMRLYTAWIAVLLKRQGTDVIRVGTNEIAGALEGFSCTVSREGGAESGEYVIRLSAAEGSADPAGGKEADT